MTAAAIAAQDATDLAAPAQEVQEFETPVATAQARGLVGRIRRLLFGASGDDDLTQAEHKVPFLALVLSIFGGLGYIAYVGHAEMIYLWQVPWAYKIAPGFLIALLLVQDIAADISMIRSMPRFAVYIRRPGWYKAIAIEMLLFILVVGGSMTLTLFSIAQVTDQNPAALFQTKALVPATDPRFTAILWLRSGLFFWTLLQLVLTSGKIPADMITMKEMLIAKLGGYVREQMQRLPVRNQFLVPAMKVFAASLGKQTDAELVDTVNEFTKGTENKIREEERRKVLAEMEGQHAEDRQRFMDQIAQRDEHVDRINEALRTALHAVMDGEEIPADAMALLPDMATFARAVRRPAPRAARASSGEAPARAPRVEVAVDTSIPLGAWVVSGKPFAKTKDQSILVATAGSAAKLVNVKEDTLRLWIVKANADHGRDSAWVAGTRGSAVCMPYDEMLALIREKAADKLRDGIDLAALETQAQGWRTAKIAA